MNSEPPGLKAEEEDGVEGEKRDEVSGGCSSKHCVAFWFLCT